ncbi:MAG: DUF1015 domain-containing protein [Dysosmobacter sp.]|jgi:hypothetical protein|uniref:DUF1015 domain-containing protein n=1 Tax=Dysosmobacter sp. TaxID=2591382 RepID=UPI003D914648
MGAFELQKDSLFDAVGFYPADILLPRGADMNKWAVIACDQFTSQAEYWQAVEAAVGDAPSTLRLILPEARLGQEGEADEIAAIHNAMTSYLERGLFRTLPRSMVYVRRTQTDGRVRQGLVGMVDLEQYDFTPGSGALIRATEGTVLSRIPPRMAVRRGAPLELPHVMLLIDDPEHTVIEPLAAGEGMEPLYDFDLLQGGGHLHGSRLTEAQMEQTAQALARLAGGEEHPMLFAVGDGNHSLAAAKACYEERKASAPEGAVLPERFALVEVVNCHDPALTFEPIHRCLFGVEPEAVLSALLAYYPGAHRGEGEGHTVSFTWSGGSGTITVPQPRAHLAVGTLQTFLDDYLASHAGRLDYIHGEEAARSLGRRSGNLAFCLPAMEKSQLFPTVMADGVLPRKAFSMGEARDKRYYVEARRLR